MSRCVVAGAGIVGVSTALWLQRAGYEVTLVDREGPAAGTSFGNAGVLAATAAVPVTVPGLWKKAPQMLFNPNDALFLKWSYLPRLTPFLLKYLSYCNDDAVRFYAGAMGHLISDSLEQHQALAAGTGAERYIKDVPYCFGYENEKTFEADAKYRKLSSDTGYRFEIVSGAEHAKDDPFFSGCFTHVVKWRNCGMISDPGAYVTALADAFIRKGGKLEIATVLDIRTDGNRVSALITDKGEMDGDEFILTTGAWSKPLMAKLGISVPLESERGYHIELVNSSDAPRTPMMLAAQKFVVTPMEGRLRCAGLVEFGGTDAPAGKAPVKMLKHHVKRLFPDLRYDRISEWLGHRPATPDSLPLIGALETFKNIRTGFGHQHLGLTAGPKTGRMIAAELAGDLPNTDMKPYSPHRFS